MFVIAKVGFLSDRNDFPPKKIQLTPLQKLHFHSETQFHYTHTQTKSLLSDLWKAWYVLNHMQDALGSDVFMTSQHTFNHHVSPSGSNYLQNTLDEKHF